MQMSAEIKKDVIDVLKNVKKFLDKGDGDKILEWSDHIIHSASIYQDENTIALAVITYALGKTLKKMPEITKKGKFCILCGGYIDDAITSAKNDDWVNYHEALEKMTQDILRIDKEYSHHLEYVINAAKIKKGSKMVAHGISIGRVAETLGITQWELMGYIGGSIETEVSEVDHKTLKHKFKFAKEVFK